MSRFLRGFEYELRTVSSDVTLTASDSVVLCSASSAAFTVTLPSAVGLTGHMFYIKKTDSSLNGVTIDGSGSQTIDGAATYVLRTQYECIQITSDGSNWVIVESNEPKNILRGVVPTASGWGTAPTNLANCTDGDLSTVTGTGSKVMGGAGDYGYVVFDLGSVKTVLVGFRVGLWSTSNTASVYVDGSPDNVTFYSTTNVNVSNASAVELISDATNCAILTCRYIRLRFNINGAATANAKIYEAMAYELSV